MRNISTTPVTKDSVCIFIAYSDAFSVSNSLYILYDTDCIPPSIRKELLVAYKIFYNTKREKYKTVSKMRNHL